MLVLPSRVQLQSVPLLNLLWLLFLLLTGALRLWVGNGGAGLRCGIRRMRTRCLLAIMCSTSFPSRPRLAQNGLRFYRCLHLPVEFSGAYLIKRRDVEPPVLPMAQRVSNFGPRSARLGTTPVDDFTWLGSTSATLCMLHEYHDSTGEPKSQSCL